MTGDPEGSTAIRELDADTVARIAAGEVVERPASAVKELVENSLDADASRIDVTVGEGGTELIRVADDGHGMSEADLRAAVRQHTTSKIEGIGDLERGVATLGFRGEALHTIGSVSRLTIRSRPREAAGAGRELVYEGGELVEIQPVGCPEGTIVEVTDLFCNTPARRKFLKTTATEFAHVSRVVTRYALANPEVAVSLNHDGREVFATTGRGELREAVLAVYGREVAEGMIPVDAGGEELPAGPLEGISGLVSHPEVNRSSREYLSTYVNGRSVTSGAIREGIVDAYGGQLGDRYPFAVLFLTVPGEAVDVNVHPRKARVRFDDDDAVRRGVETAVREALLEEGLLRSRAPRGRSAPGEARIEPGESAASPDESGEARIEPGESAASPDESGDAAERTGGDTDCRSAPETVDDRKPAHGVADTRDAETATVDSRESRDDGTTDTVTDGPDRSPTESAGSPDSRADHADGRTDHADRRADHADRPTDRKFVGEADQRTLDGEAAIGEGRRFDSLPPLRVLGQLRETFLVCESPDGLVLVDQHAADERVNYERLREAFSAETTVQTLADPVELELTAAEAETFASCREALARLGFRAESTDGRRLAVTGVPAALTTILEPERLRDVLTAMVTGDQKAGAETVEAIAEGFLSDMACHPSITGNTSLTEGSTLGLLEALDDCENPYACPHGRPVLVEIDADELEDRFERDYPGHG